MKKLTKKEIKEYADRQKKRDKLAKINKIVEYDKRMKAILKAYDDGNRDLFNWCEDYKTFINDSVHSNVNSMVDYILKKSYEDRDAPFNYDDFDMTYIDYEQLKRDLLNDENIRGEFIEWQKENGEIEFDHDSFVIEDEVELDRFLEDRQLRYDYEKTAEVYEWWIIGDPLLYRLQKAGEVIYDDIWGRQTTGQNISLDGCCIHAFIDPLRETYGKKKKGK